jgi:ABC-type transport system involved in cytochrome c biogenesis ATPase subunit
LERLFEEKTRQYYNQILRNVDSDMPLRRFLFCRKDYSQLVLLAFFLSNAQSAKQLLYNYLGIESFESALFVLRTPSWGHSRTKRKSDQEEVDSRFWNARGAFRPFLGRLWDSAFAPIRNDEVIERDIRRRGEPTQRLYLFIKDEKQLAALRATYETTKLFFTNLEALFLCDLIDEVRINVKKKDGSRVSFSQLSEGEQQLLTVLGMMMFTQGDESLYLLDEPDTHLNPLWTYDFLKLMEETIHAASGQLIIATHNPLMIGTLHKNQVRVLRQEDQATVADEPEYDPIGIGVEGLLKSELYGLPSTLAPEVIEDIYTQNELLALPKRNNEQDRQLQEVTERLGKLGITRSHPNPLFDLFSKAIANQPQFQKPVLTKEDIEAQEKLASAILDKILRKSE